MPKQRLKSMLEELHSEIGTTEKVGEEDRQLIEGLLNDIQHKLDADEAEDDEPSIVDRLRDSVERFEGEHPTLSESLMRVIDQLAKIGI